MSIIERVGGELAAEKVLKSPLEIRSSHYNVKDRTFLAKLHYIQTKPWRLIPSPDPYDMVVIDDPNLDDLISLDALSAAMVDAKFKQAENECVILNEKSGLLVSGMAGKGQAVYFTRSCDEAMKTTISEALDIIVKMRCSDEERQSMKILTSLCQT